MVMEAEFCKVQRALEYYNGENGGKMCSTFNLMEKMSKKCLRALYMLYNHRHNRNLRSSTDVLKSFYQQGENK